METGFVREDYDGLLSGLNAARSADWGLLRFGNMLLIGLSGGAIISAGSRARSFFASLFSPQKTERFRPRVNLFLCDFRKAQGGKPLMKEGLRGGAAGVHPAS